MPNQGAPAADASEQVPLPRSTRSTRSTRASVERLGARAAQRAEREQQVLDVATAEFARSGYASASMAMIASRSGVSKAVLYRYFGSKEALFVAAVRRIADQLVAGITAQMGASASLEQPLAVLQAVFAVLEPQRHMWSVVVDPSVPQRGEIARTVRRYRRQVGELATAGSSQFLRDRGNADASDAAALAAMWMSGVSALVEWWLEHPRETAADMDARAARLMTALLGSASREPATASREPATASREPATASRESATASREPATASREPAATRESITAPR